MSAIPFAVALMLFSLILKGLGMRLANQIGFADVTCCSRSMRAMICLGLFPRGLFRSSDGVCDTCIASFPGSPDSKLPNRTGESGIFCAFDGWLWGP